MELFDELEQAPDASVALDKLIAQLEAEHRYAHAFEATLMKRRHELGLPLMEPAIPDQLRPEWEQFVMTAARKAGDRYLAEGNVARAWPYFRALGEPGPVRSAIESLPADKGSDEVIEVALYEKVHPVRGYEMILAQHGTCRAITCMDQYPDADSREAALEILARRLDTELRENIARTIEKNEGKAPEAGASLQELIAGRDWLFGEYDYYVDTSHLLSVMRFAADSANREVWRIGVGLAAYGEKLGSMFQYEGEPPFDKPYVDYGIFLRGLLGENVDAAVDHFERKVIETDPERAGSYPAQVLVRYLLRLSRPQQAIAIFEKYLIDNDPNYLTCPNLIQLCQMAGDWDRLKRVAREKGDLLNFAAAAVQSRR